MTRHVIAIYLLLCAVVIISTWIMNTVLRSARGRGWAKRHWDWSTTVNKKSWPILIREGNRQFIELFEIIYGRKFLSWRRIIASVLSTTLALVFIVALMGWQNTFVYDFLDDLTPEAAITGGPWLALIAFMFSLIPDYFSLQETRWTLEKSHKSSIIIWFLVDLSLTTIIFILSVVVVVSLAGFGVNLIEGMHLQEAVQEAIKNSMSVIFSDLLLDSSGFLPFFLTTFFTSAFWFFFVVYAILLKLLQTSSAFGQKFAIAAVSNEAPANVIGGLLILAITMLFMSYGVVSALLF